MMEHVVLVWNNTSVVILKVEIEDFAILMGFCEGKVVKTFSNTSTSSWVWIFRTVGETFPLRTVVYSFWRPRWTRSNEKVGLVFENVLQSLKYVDSRRLRCIVTEIGSRSCNLVKFVPPSKPLCFGVHKICLKNIPSLMCMYWDLLSRREFSTLVSSSYYYAFLNYVDSVLLVNLILSTNNFTCWRRVI